ncbi:hypothetical protein Tco_1507385, partial [Tanacetum coccineum]
MTTMVVVLWWSGDDVACRWIYGGVAMGVMLVSEVGWWQPWWQCGDDDVGGMMMWLVARMWRLVAER